jgi:N-acetylglutamate synthase/N-acetylornithine aminotransferase
MPPGEAHVIAHSPLVKTALRQRPNLGRTRQAVGDAALMISTRPVLICTLMMYYG